MICLGVIILLCWEAGEHLKDKILRSLETAAEARTGKQTVVLDSGHGGSDSGKVGINGAKEKEINLLIAKEIRRLLEKEKIEVIMVREKDEELGKRKEEDLKYRDSLMNEKKPSLAVSIHQNSYHEEYVKGAQVAVSGITLDKQELNLTVGEVSDPLVATVLPQDAMDKTVTWQSSDTKVATVDDNGAVTAVSAGSAVITAVTKDGNFSAACSVTVELNEDAIDLTTFSFTLKSSTRDGTMFEFPDLQIERVTEDTYRLNVPVYAVYDEATGRTVSIEMSAPDDWDKDFTVTYTAWASAVDGRINKKQTDKALLTVGIA